VIDSGPVLLAAITRGHLVVRMYPIG